MWQNKMRKYKYPGYSSTFLLASWAILLICIIARIFMLIHPKDLWIDELYIWDILSRDSLLTILGGEYASSAKAQSAPLLFMLVNKFIIDCFGESYIALYSPSFIASCLAVFLVWRIGAKIDIPYMFSSLFIFSLCLIPLYYTIEFKQYGWELCASLMLVYTAMKNISEAGYNRRRIFSGRNTCLYIFCILISTPAILFIFGIVAAQIMLIIFKNSDKCKKTFKGYLKSFIDVLQGNKFNLGIFILFILIYYYFYLDHTNSDHMKNYWRQYLIPLNPSELWTYFKTIAMPIFVKGLFWPQPFGFVMLFSFILGSVIMWKAKKDFFWLLFAPMLVTFLANFKFYPPGQPDAPHGARLLLFLAPNIILAASWIFKAIFDFITARMPNRIRNLNLALTLAVCICISVVWNFSYLSKEEYFCEQLENLVNIIKLNFREGDKIFIGAQTVLAYSYLKTQIGSLPSATVLPPDYVDYRKTILDTDRQNAIFALFTHISGHKKFLPDALATDLHQAGRLVTVIPDTGSLLFIIH